MKKIKGLAELKKIDGLKVDLERKTMEVSMEVKISPIPTKVKKVDLAADDTPTQPETNPETNEDLVSKRFRLISKTLIDGYWFPIDLTRDGVLKKGLPLFQQDLSLMIDHEKVVKSIVGGVRDVDYNSETDPEGVDANLIVDRLMDEQVARAVEMGWTNRCSITFSFVWEQSHPDLEPNVFWDTLWEEIDGEMVRLIVTEITSVTEVSLVYYGADSTAKSLDKKTNQNKPALPESIEKEENKQMDEELRTLVESALNRKISTEAQLRQAVRDIVKEKQNLESSNAELETQVADLQERKEFADKLEADLKKEVTRLAKVVGNGKIGKAHQLILDMGKYDDWKELETELKEAEEKMFPWTCVKCGKTTVERRSSVELTVNPDRPEEPGFDEDYQVVH